MRQLRLKNTYSGNVEPLVPLDPSGKTVTMYSCGPTVYSFAHIGNFRSFLFANVLRRTLTRHGYVVKQVMNITDVGHMTEDHLADASGEDKLSRAARELGTDPYKVAEHFERAFVADAKTLGLAIYSGEEADRPELHPKATRHVPEMLAMIQRLLDRGFAYVVPSGEVYFEVSKFPDYGKLSGKVLEDLEAGARVAVREEKKDPRDFALWKVDDKHLMLWDPHSDSGWPAGDYERYRALAPKGVDARIKRGFPGWHIECSAMSRAHLAETIDVHTGGEDNIFPHHECEIAQSQGAHGAPLARHWVHGRHLLVNNRKMSKRDGTFFTVRDLLDPHGEGRADLAKDLEKVGFPEGKTPANVLRFALVGAPYTQPMNFSMELLAQAKASVERLQSSYQRLSELAATAAAGDAAGAGPAIAELLQKKSDAFDDALDDNLNTANAIAAWFDLVTALNQKESELTPGDAKEALRVMDGMDGVLGVLDRRVSAGLVTLASMNDALAAGRVPMAEAPDGPLDAGTIEALIFARHAARKAKDFAKADKLRDLFKARGVQIDDAAQGVRWKLL